MEFVRTLASFIETAGVLIVVTYCSAAFALVIWHRDRLRAQRLVGEGVLNALSLILCATLLKTLFLTTWRQIGFFASVFLLRTLLKRVFVAEASGARPIGRSAKARARKAPTCCARVKGEGYADGSRLGRLACFPTKYGQTRRGATSIGADKATKDGL